MDGNAMTLCAAEDVFEPFWLDGRDLGEKV